MKKYYLNTHATYEVQISVMAESPEEALRLVDEGEWDYEDGGDFVEFTGPVLYIVDEEEVE